MLIAPTALPLAMPALFLLAEHPKTPATGAATR